MARYDTDGSGALASQDDREADDSALSSNDPYNELQASAKDSIRPKFNVIKGGGQGDGAPKGDLHPVSSRQAAEETASEAEKLGTSKDTFTGINKVKGKDPLKDQKSMVKQLAKGSALKKAAPAISVGVVVAVIGIAIFTALNAMLFHVRENLVLKNSGLFASQAQKDRAEKDYIYMLEGNEALAGTIDDELGHPDISEENCSILKAKGSLIPSKSLCPDGNEEDSDIESYYRQKALEDTTIASVDTSPPASSGQGHVIKFIDSNNGVHLIDAGNFSEYFRTNPEFQKEMSLGAKGWTGQISGWFDEIANKVLSNLLVTRNKFASYVESTEAKADYFKIIDENKDLATSTVAANEKLVLYDDVDKDGFCIGPHEVAVARLVYLRDREEEEWLDLNDNGEGTSETKCMSRETGRSEPLTMYAIVTISTKISEDLEANKAAIRTSLPNLASTFNLTSSSCNKAFGVAYFSAVVAATRLEQSVKFASEILEGIDKTKYGLGHQAPIHTSAQHLSSKSTYYYMREDGMVVESDTNRAGLNSEGLSWVNTNAAINLEDPNVKKLSLEGIIQGATITVSQALACSFVDYSGNFLYGAINFLSGGRSRVQSDSVQNNTGNTEEPEYNDGDLLDMAIERAAYSLSFNPCTNEAGGEDVGNCLALGTRYYLASNLQASGGSPADKNKVLQFNKEQRTVVAQAAERERSVLSPFDTSSPYTFLGSIINQIGSYASSFMTSSLFASVGTIVSSSINSLLPSASALEESTINSNIGNCNYLEDIGAVGDAFCVPYIITDLDPNMTKLSFHDITEKVKDELKTDENGKLAIKENTQFAQYVKYCSARTAMFGVIDPYIMADYTNTLSASANDAEGEGENRPGLAGLINKVINGITDAWNRAKNFFKGLFEGVDVAEENKDHAIGWATGKYCVATDDEEVNPMWEKNKYYQAYTTFDRIRANRIGNDSARPAAMAIIDEWEKQLPETNTSEDLVARLAGMSTTEYLIAKNYILYQATDKSSFGPTIATTSTATATYTFRRSITPLTDLFIENILPETSPDIQDPRRQGTTA